MADPICRWRNSSIKQVVEFNILLPLSPCTKKEARAVVEHRWAVFGGKDFFQTPYQLAAQMGLYYEDDQFFYPRFDKLISIEEATDYMEYWGKHYYAPNPYTRSMTTTKEPIIINRFLVNWVLDHENPLFSEALRSMFTEDIGNTDVLVNMINNFTDVTISNDIISIKPNAPHNRFKDVSPKLGINDKKGFFEFVGKNIGSSISLTNAPLLPLQQIFYGAPGTGKSHTIKDCTNGKDVIRTTFHPDSDYSTFVGAYKPTTKEVPVYSPFGEKVVVAKDADGTPIVEDKIVYEFVEQAFLQAYISAWKKYSEANDGEQPKEQYLIIEEINRGNCAQIFGDLFQLLDRNDAGFSDYPIKADNDMAKHLKKALCKLEIKAKESINGLYSEEYDDVVAEVLKGKVLLLPNNLFIWATMNTSDQSLFPIDSAFKRRWEWKYIPISNAAKGWVIEANGNRYDWWAFLEKINSVICGTTSSEDKKLGYFFAKADNNGVISADKFVGKVAFYLWNDVFKDYGFENDIFNGENGKSIAFQEFFLADGKANEIMVEKFLKNLGLTASVILNNDNGEEDDEDTDGILGKDQTKYSINGVGRYAKKNIATELIKKYCSEHSEMTAKEVVAEWKPLSYLVNHFIETQEEFDKRQDKKDRMAIIVHNGDNIYVSTNGWGGKSKMEELKDALRKKDLGLQISEVIDENN